MRVATTVTRRFKFCAAHHLTDDASPCANVHGHNFELFVTVAGEVQLGGENDGMVVPFDELKRVWRLIEKQLDHQDLNEVLNMERPTTERLAIWLLNTFHGAGINVARVHVTETENNSATAYWEDD